MAIMLTITTFIWGLNNTKEITLIMLSLFSIISIVTLGIIKQIKRFPRVTDGYWQYYKDQHKRVKELLSNEDYDRVWHEKEVSDEKE